MSINFSWQTPELPYQLNEHSQKIGSPVEKWLPREEPPRSVLSGTYCRLEPFDANQHSAQLFEAYSLNTDTSNWTYLPYGPFTSEKEFFDWCSTACTGDDPLFYTVIDQTNERALGLASYLRIAPAAGSIEVGNIHFSPSLKATRLATEAMYLMMSRAFDELGYRRYEWKCDALNAPSCQAAKRFGFQFEGIFRQAVVYKNRNRDTAWFAIIDSEWPKLRAGYEAWLAADNFDAGGQQQRSLTQCFHSTG